VPNLHELEEKLLFNDDNFKYAKKLELDIDLAEI
jgi:hypothetical protein